jgi:hypothetical protein
VKLVNLTPHDLHVFVGEEYVVTIPREGNEQIPRCAETQARVDTAEIVSDGVRYGVPIYAMAYGAVDYLPQPQEGVAYVVSRMVAEAEPQRRDLLWPVSFVREGESGRILGCRAFGALDERR